VINDRESTPLRFGLTNQGEMELSREKDGIWEVFATLPGFIYQTMVTCSVAFSKQGKIFVSHPTENRIEVVEPCGGIFYITRFRSSSLSEPQGMAINSKDELIVCDSGSNRVITYDINQGFKPLRSFRMDDQLSSPWSVVVDEMDNIYVAERDSNRLWCLDENGNYRLPKPVFIETSNQPRIKYKGGVLTIVSSSSKKSQYQLYERKNNTSA